MSEPGFSPVVSGFRPVIPRTVLVARQEAEALLAAAEHEAAAIRGSAAEEVAQAVAAGRASAERDAEALAASRLEAADALVAARLEALESACVDAVLAVAERVWRTLPVDRSRAAAAVLRELHAELGAQPGLVFHVHPADLGAIGRTAPDVVPDASLSPGDCVVEGPAGLYDGRAEVRAAVAIGALAGALGRPDPSELEVSE